MSITNYIYVPKQKVIKSNKNNKKKFFLKQIILLKILQMKKNKFQLESSQLENGIQFGTISVLNRIIFILESSGKIIDFMQI